MLILAVGLNFIAVGGAKAANDRENSATHLLYEAYWGGLHVADLTLSMQVNNHKFNNRLKLESRGLARNWIPAFAGMTFHGDSIFLFLSVDYVYTTEN